MDGDGIVDPHPDARFLQGLDDVIPLAVERPHHEQVVRMKRGP